MLECSICLEDINTSIELELECGHIFHRKCISGLSTHVCPLCRHSIDVKKLFNINNKLCNDEDSSHDEFGYAPNVIDGPCRYCTGKPLHIYLKNL